MTEQTDNIHKFQHRSDTMLLRVAAVQLPRLSAEDREPDEAEPIPALRKYVERDMGAIPQKPEKKEK